MATNSSVVLVDPQETSSEVKAIAGFLAGYSGQPGRRTRSTCACLPVCDEHRLELFLVTRSHIDLYARELKELGRGPATISRRLPASAGFYRYAAEKA